MDVALIIAIGMISLGGAVFLVYMRWKRWKSLGKGGDGNPTPIMWRETRWLVYAIVGFCVIARLFSDRVEMVSSPWRKYAGLASLVVALGLVAVIEVRRHRWRKVAQRFDGALCPNCGYALRGLPEKHYCPECGNPFDIRKVKKDWKRATEKSQFLEP